MTEITFSMKNQSAVKAVNRCNFSDFTAYLSRKQEFRDSVKDKNDFILLYGDFVAEDETKSLKLPISLLLRLILPPLFLIDRRQTDTV